MEDQPAFIDSFATSPPPHQGNGRDRPDLHRRPVTGHLAAAVIDSVLSLPERVAGALALVLLDRHHRLVTAVAVSDVGPDHHRLAAPESLLSLADNVRELGGYVVFARGREGPPFITPGDLDWVAYAEGLFGAQLSECFLATTDLVRPLVPFGLSGATPIPAC